MRFGRNDLERRCGGNDLERRCGGNDLGRRWGVETELSKSETEDSHIHQYTVYVRGMSWTMKQALVYTTGIHHTYNKHCTSYIQQTLYIIHTTNIVHHTYNKHTSYIQQTLYIIHTTNIIHHNIYRSDHVYIFYLGHRIYEIFYMVSYVNLQNLQYYH